MYDIVRCVPLTLMHPAHPALQSEHQHPIQENLPVQQHHNLVVSSFSPNDGVRRQSR
jgi:hypothetical protein